MAIRSRDPLTRDMLAYARLILGEAMSHGGTGWLEYDRAARQQRAIDPWNVLDPGLHSAFILSRSSSSFIKRCKRCYVTMWLANVLWRLWTLSRGKEGVNHVAALLFASLGTGVHAVSQALATIAMCVPAVLGVIGLEIAQLLGVFQPLLEQGEGSSRHPSINTVSFTVVLFLLFI